MPEEKPSNDVSSVDSDVSGPQGEEQPESLFIPMGAKPDTPLTESLTLSDVAEAFGLNAAAPGTVRQLREIMGTEALPEMTAQEYLYYNEYVELWDEEPPEGYIEEAMASGMNPKEFADAERQKPAWSQTPAYAKKESENVSALDEFLTNGEQAPSMQAPPGTPGAPPPETEMTI